MKMKCFFAVCLLLTVLSIIINADAVNPEYARNLADIHMLPNNLLKAIFNTIPSRPLPSDNRRFVRYKGIYYYVPRFNINTMLLPYTMLVQDPYVPEYLQTRVKTSQQITANINKDLVKFKSDIKKRCILSAVQRESPQPADKSDLGTPLFYARYSGDNFDMSYPQYKGIYRTLRYPYTTKDLEENQQKRRAIVAFHPYFQKFFTFPTPMSLFYPLTVPNHGLFRHRR